MKKFFLLLIFLPGTFAHAQYFQRWFGNATTPAKEHTFYDGLCTKKNFSASDTNFYNVGVGTARLPTITGTLTKYREMRYVRTHRNGTTVYINNGYGFKDNGDATNKWFHAAANSVCEIDSSDHNGGYIAIGQVESNSLTGSSVAGGSDALITKIANGGTINMQYRVDFKNGGKDVLYSVIASSTESKKFYACGTSEFTNNKNLIVIKFDEGGTISWAKSYRFNIAGSATNTKTYGYSIAQNPLNGELLVVGSIEDPGAFADQEALIVRLDGGGSVLSADAYDYNLFDEYRSVKWSGTGEFIICGSYTDNVYGYVLAAKTDGAGVPLLHKKIIMSSAEGNTDCKAYEIVERQSPESSYYIIANGLYSSGAVTTVVIKTNLLCEPIALYEYGITGISGAEAIDLSEVSDYSEGVRLFTNIKDYSSAGKIDAHMIKTYFNGVTCTNYCPEDSFSFSNQDPDPVFVLTDNIYTQKSKVKLSSAITTYKTVSICSQSNIACGSNAKTAIGIEDLEWSSTSNLKIFPNPASQFVQLDLTLQEESVVSILISDLSGRMVKTVLQHKVLEPGNYNEQVDCSDIPPGVYNCIIVHNNNQRHAKLVIEH